VPADLQASVARFSEREFSARMKSVLGP